MKNRKKNNGDVEGLVWAYYDGSRYDKCTHSNKVCLITTKYTMEKIINDNIRHIGNVREYFNAIDGKFKRFTTYDGVGGVREHVIKIVNWYNKLKSIKVELGEDFLIGRTSYNAQQNVEWSIDEMISILTQEKEIIRKGKSHNVQFIFHNDNNKKKKFLKVKDICVPITLVIMGGFRYFITFIDSFFKTFKATTELKPRCEFYGRHNVPCLAYLNKMELLKGGIIQL
ncbi:hypothetical protein CR513_44960, partial [Mucuna pruriens]